MGMDSDADRMGKLADRVRSLRQRPAPGNNGVRYDDNGRVTGLPGGISGGMPNGVLPNLGTTQMPDVSRTTLPGRAGGAAPSLAGSMYSNRPPSPAMPQPTVPYLQHQNRFEPDPNANAYTRPAGPDVGDMGYLPPSEMTDNGLALGPGGGNVNNPSFTEALRRRDAVINAERQRQQTNRTQGAAADSLRRQLEFERQYTANGGRVADLPGGNMAPADELARQRAYDQMIAQRAGGGRLGPGGQENLTRIISGVTEGDTPAYGRAGDYRSAGREALQQQRYRESLMTTPGGLQNRAGMGSGLPPATRTDGTVMVGNRFVKVPPNAVPVDNRMPAPGDYQRPDGGYSDRYRERMYEQMDNENITKDDMANRRANYMADREGKSEWNRRARRKGGANYRNSLQSQAAANAPVTQNKHPFKREVPGAENLPPDERQAAEIAAMTDGIIDKIDSFDGDIGTIINDPDFQNLPSADIQRAIDDMRDRMTIFPSTTNDLMRDYINVLENIARSREESKRKPLPGQPPAGFKPESTKEASERKRWERVHDAVQWGM